MVGGGGFLLSRPPAADRAAQLRCPGTRACARLPRLTTAAVPLAPSPSLLLLVVFRFACHLSPRFAVLRVAADPSTATLLPCSALLLLSAQPVPCALSAHAPPTNAYNIRQTLFGPARRSGATPPCRPLAKFTCEANSRSLLIRYQGGYKEAGTGAVNKIAALSSSGEKEGRTGACSLENDGLPARYCAGASRVLVSFSLLPVRSCKDTWP